MASNKQIEANRANARKSTGPTSSATPILGTQIMLFTGLY